MEIKQSLLYNPWIKEEITRETRKHFELNDKIQHIKISAKQVKQRREIYRFKILEKKAFKSMSLGSTLSKERTNNTEQIEEIIKGKTVIESMHI